jgi:hypothetical protein
MVGFVRTDPQMARITSVTVGCCSASSSSRPLTAFTCGASRSSNAFEGNEGNLSVGQRENFRWVAFVQET